MELILVEIFFLIILPAAVPAGIVHCLILRQEKYGVYIKISRLPFLYMGIPAVSIFFSLVMFMLSYRTRSFWPFYLYYGALLVAGAILIARQEQNLRLRKTLNAEEQAELEDCLNLLKTQPDNITLHEKLARLYAKDENTDEALRHIDIAIKSYNNMIYSRDLRELKEELLRKKALSEAAAKQK